MARQPIGAQQNTSTSRQGGDRRNAQTRRTRSTPRRTRQMTRKALETRQAPPVMVRAGASEMDLPGMKRKKPKAARRRYDLALSMPGAEVRLPALPQIAFSARWISGFLVVVLGLLAYQLWNAAMFQVVEPEIVGLQRLSSRDVNAVLGVTGEPIFGIYTQELERRLREAFPEFSSVSVETSLPDQVQVTVTERRPLLIWKQEGRTVLVDANGIAFPLRNEAESGDLLVIEAYSAPPVGEQAVIEEQTVQLLPVEMISAMLSISAVAPPNTHLIYDAQHGLGWQDAAGWQVYFGDIRQIDMKLNVYRALVDKFKKEKLNPVLVSVEYVHAPYYRLGR